MNPVLALTFFVLAGNGASKPTYELIIGDKKVVLPVHDSAQDIQNDILNHLKPLWRNLRSGNSATFHLRRVSSLDVSKDAKDAVEKTLGKGVTITSSITTMTTPPLRFFKNRDGLNGLELLDKKSDIQRAGPNVNWSDIDSYIREQTYDLENIQTLIQHTLNDYIKF